MAQRVESRDNSRSKNQEIIKNSHSHHNLGALGTSYKESNVVRTSITRDQHIQGNHVVHHDGTIQRSNVVHHEQLGHTHSGVPRRIDHGHNILQSTHNNELRISDGHIHAHQSSNVIRNVRVSRDNSRIAQNQPQIALGSSTKQIVHHTGSTSVEQVRRSLTSQPNGTIVRRTSQSKSPIHGNRLTGTETQNVMRNSKSSR